MSYPHRRMTEFQLYLQLGFAHISDVRAYDHILFLAALCAIYDWGAWKRLLWLVTAFTIGHSATLALATLGVLGINEDLVELLIPITILIASIVNIVSKPDVERKQSMIAKYGLALGFGLIHGLGFSTFLRAVLGAEESIVLPLFAFNLGLEVGQLLIVGILLLLTVAMTQGVKMKHREWTLLLSGATAGIALTMIIDKLAA